MLSSLQFKRDPLIALVYVTLIVCATYLVATGRVTLRELAGFFAGSAIMPSLFGRAAPPPPPAIAAEVSRATTPDPPRASESESESSDGDA